MLQQILEVQRQKTLRLHISTDLIQVKAQEKGPGARNERRRKNNWLNPKWPRTGAMQNEMEWSWVVIGRIANAKASQVHKCDGSMPIHLLDSTAEDKEDDTRLTWTYLSCLLDWQTLGKDMSLQKNICFHGKSINLSLHKVQECLFFNKFTTD